MDTIPRRTQDAIDAYVAHGVPPGGFLYAVLTNDLFGATGRADQENRAALLDICRYVYNEIPSACWGSTEKMLAWIAKHEAVTK
jgi:hypothetical protein